MVVVELDGDDDRIGTGEESYVNIIILRLQITDCAVIFLYVLYLQVSCYYMLFNTSNDILLTLNALPTLSLKVS